MLGDQLGLKRDRARIEGVEQRHVAHRRERDADQRARAIGDLRIDEIEQHVEIVLGRLLMRELARQPAGVDAALDAPAEFVEYPARAAVEVLVEQAGERGDRGQRFVDTVEDLAIRPAARSGASTMTRLQPADQLPGLLRQPLANDGGGVDARRARSKARSRSCRGSRSAVSAGREVASTFGVDRAPGDAAGPSGARSIRARRSPARRDRPRARRGSAPAAASPPRARDSGRTRTDCRPRGSADCRACATIWHLFRASAAALVASTGLSASTQTSADSTPCAHRNRARVGLVGNAREPARHHPPAVRRRGDVDAQHERPRDQLAALPARHGREPHDFLADIVERRASRSRARQRLAVQPRKVRRRQRRGRFSSPARRRRRRRRPRRCRELRARARARRAGRTTRSRYWASPARRRAGRARAAAGTRASRAIRQDPSPACSRPRRRRRGSRRCSPGTPIREAELSSSGSHHSASTWRQITSARFRPAMVRTKHAARRATTRSSPSHQQKAEIAREIGLLEIGRAAAGRGSLCRCAARDRSPLAFRPARNSRKNGATPLDVHLAIEVGKRLRDDEPVLQRIARAGRRLRAVAEHPPVARRGRGRCRRRRA